MNEFMNNIRRLKQTINMVRNYHNPEMFVRSLIERNPNAKRAIEYVEENGGDPKAAFIRLANEKGIDPLEVMNMLR